MTAKSGLIRPDDKLAFLLIDFQEKLFAVMPKEKQEPAIHSWKMLLEAAHKLDRQVIYTQQYSKGLGPTLAPLKSKLDELGLTSIEKKVFSVCRVEDIQLPSKDTTLVVGGMETHICVLQTVLDLLDAGYSVIVPEDATISRYTSDQTRALSIMEKSGAIISTSETVAMQLVGSAQSPHFRSFSKLMKERP